MEKVLRNINRLEELAIGYALLLLAVVACIQVVLRYVFGMAFDWVDELSRYVCILITFVGAGVCVRYGTHFCMDAFVQFAPNRIKHLLKTLSNLVSALIMATAAYYGWVQIAKLARFGTTTPTLQIPMYVPYLPIGIFCAVIALRFLIQSLKHAKGLMWNTPFDARKGAH